MSGNKALSISMIICTANRAQYLRSLLCTLERQTYPHFEVIVVVGPGDDETDSVLAGFEGRIQVCACPTFNLSVSRNIGIEAATGDVVAFLDDDSLPGINWLSQLVDALSPPDIIGTGGKVYRIWPNGEGDIQFLNGMSSVMGDDADVWQNNNAIPKWGIPSHWWFPRLTGGNMAYYRNVLVEVGGFDERFAYMFEEADLAVRLGQARYRIKPLSQAVVYHFPAGGPNRQAKTMNVNWYAWVRGTIYFALKNGRHTAGLFAAVSRAVHHCFSTFRRVSDYKSVQQHEAVRQKDVYLQLIKGILWGFTVGLAGSRQLRRQFSQPDRQFVPFLRNDSARTPCILPSGKPLPPTLHTLPAAPLRIAFFSSIVGDKTDECLSQRELELAHNLTVKGHEVHLLCNGSEDKVTSIGGALIHHVPVKLDRYLWLHQCGYFTLFRQLNYSHALHNRLLALNADHQIQLVISPLKQFEGFVTAVSGRVPVRIIDTDRPQNPPNGRSDQLEIQLWQQLQTEFLTHSFLPDTNISVEALIQHFRTIVELPAC